MLITNAETDEITRVNFDEELPLQPAVSDRVVAEDADRADMVVPQDSQLTIVQQAEIIVEPKHGSIEWLNYHWGLAEKHDAQAKLHRQAILYYIFSQWSQRKVTLKEYWEELNGEGFVGSYPTFQRHISQLPEYKELKQQKQINPSAGTLRQRQYEERKRQKSQAEISNTDEEPAIEVQCAELQQSTVVDSPATEEPYEDDLLWYDDAPKGIDEIATLKSRITELEEENHKLKEELADYQSNPYVEVAKLRPGGDYNYRFDPESDYISLTEEKLSELLKTHEIDCLYYVLSFYPENKDSDRTQVEEPPEEEPAPTAELPKISAVKLCEELNISLNTYNNHNGSKKYPGIKYSVPDWLDEVAPGWRDKYECDRDENGKVTQWYKRV
jgi:hypothetical protein